MCVSVRACVCTPASLCVYVCMCVHMDTCLPLRVCVCVCLPGLSLGAPCVAVLDAEHDVGAGAAAGALLEKMAAVLQGRGHACQHLLTHTPRLTEVVHLTVPFGGGAMPQLLLRPVVVREDVPAIEGVHGHTVLHSRVVEDGLPAVEHHLILEVDYGYAVSVRHADYAVEVLQLGGQEGPERSFHAYGPRLAEAQEVCPTDTPHGSSLGGI